LRFWLSIVTVQSVQNVNIAQLSYSASGLQCIAVNNKADRFFLVISNQLLNIEMSSTNNNKADRFFLLISNQLLNIEMSSTNNKKVAKKPEKKSRNCLTLDQGLEIVRLRENGLKKLIIEYA
jgi:hypothetical protein